MSPHCLDLDLQMEMCGKDLYTSKICCFFKPCQFYKGNQQFCPLCVSRDVFQVKVGAFLNVCVCVNVRWCLYIRLCAESKPSV